MDWEHSGASKDACQAMTSIILTSLGVSSAWGYLVCDLHCVENPTSNAEVSSHTIISKVCQ